MSSSSPAAPVYRRTHSDSSESSQMSSTLQQRRLPYVRNGTSPAITPINTSSQDHLRRPPPIRAVNDTGSGSQSPVEIGTESSYLRGHRRQRSQGYFEPTLPSNTPSTPTMAPQLTASQIAAQAAMHVSQDKQHNRKRSETIPGPRDPATRQTTSPPPIPVVDFSNRTHNPSAQYQYGLIGGTKVAATAAANVAFPRSPLHSPGLSNPSDNFTSSTTSERDVKPVKEKSKMKLFSKPKSIGITRDKDVDKKHPPLPSPAKVGMQSNPALNRMMMNTNASLTSLVDPSMSSASSLYSSANASTSTLVPLDKGFASVPEKEKEKEKHKHHFLSRQKNKLKDKDEHHSLALSSANSTSKLDPAMPQPLYSFAPAPASPSHSSSFATGLDLRHGGRALRQKKKEEKAAALAPYGVDPSEPSLRERGQSFQTDRSEWPGPASLGTTGTSGPSPGPSTLTHAGELASLGQTFGLPGLTPDDAWPLLKARLLHIFEGQDPRPPVEDFNALVSVHIRRCIQKRASILLIEDLAELLQTGFMSLDQTLRHVPVDELIMHLVRMWTFVFTTILPFLQAVFLPLDLEFKGRGPLMQARDATEFWGASLSHADGKDGSNQLLTKGEELDVRRITLLTFRDTVILPRNDTLIAVFSRLSLATLEAGISSGSRPSVSEIPRPSTSASLDPAMSSYNSQSSTLLDTASNPSFGSRSRATSNTSAGSFSTGVHSPEPTPVTPSMDPARTPVGPSDFQVTEMAGLVGRMLQCVSVLASVQSGDEAQTKMERLTKELKYNWLGRGRTGRQRRGFVGPRVPRGVQRPALCRFCIPRSVRNQQPTACFEHQKREVHGAQAPKITQPPAIDEDLISCLDEADSSGQKLASKLGFVKTLVYIWKRYFTRDWNRCLTLTTAVMVKWIGQRASNAPRISAADWTFHKSLILSLYQDHHLDQVMRFMQEHHDFAASKRQYTFQLFKWRAKKYGRSSGGQSRIQPKVSTLHDSVLRDDNVRSNAELSCVPIPARLEVDLGLPFMSMRDENPGNYQQQMPLRQCLSPETRLAIHQWQAELAPSVYTPAVDHERTREELPGDPMSPISHMERRSRARPASIYSHDSVSLYSARGRRRRRDCHRRASRPSSQCSERLLSVASPACDDGDVQMSAKVYSSSSELCHIVGSSLSVGTQETLATSYDDSMSIASMRSVGSRIRKRALDTDDKSAAIERPTKVSIDCMPPLLESSLFPGLPNIEFDSLEVYNALDESLASMSLEDADSDRDT